jgi:hypothetical protein
MAALAAEMAAAALDPPPDPVVLGGRTGPAWDQLPPDQTWQGGQR